MEIHNLSLQKPLEMNSSRLSLHPFENQHSLDDVLKNIFPQSTEETTLLRVRKMLGGKAKTLSDEQIASIVTEFQFLINA